MTEGGEGGRPEDLLLAAFKHGLTAVSPEKVVPAHLPESPRGRTVVVGAGKAAAAMAQALETSWPGDLTGIVVVPYGYALPCARIRVVEAAHPVPDDQGLASAREILGSVAGLSEHDLVLGLFSGGGSALLPLPAGAVTLADKRAVITQLLRVGATITEINCVRKHLSAIKGGRLAEACAPARMVSLLISDVAGDDASAIASGPGVPDPSTLAEARHVIEKYDLQVSEAVLLHLSTEANETPKPGDRGSDRVLHKIVASAGMFLGAVADFFLAQGVAAIVLGDSLEGESTEVALAHAEAARRVARRGRPAPAPCVLLSGGETTVTLRGSGKGGPNLEFLLALAAELGDDLDYAAIACDTDGIDGVSAVAGAIAGRQTLSRAAAAGLDARAALGSNDSHAFFAALGDTVVTGPTYNNVNDFRAVMVLPASTRIR